MTGRIALGAFVLALALMIPFEAMWTHLVGLVFLFVFVIAGVFALATPELLDDGDE
jgi:hypothetical protein